MVWKYVEVLNTGLAVLLNVGAGVGVGGFNVLPPRAYTILNGAVFKVFLPALVCRGIGIKTDLYEDDIWRFIGAFLVLRAIALVVAGVSSLRPIRRQEWCSWPGRTVIDWLGLAWISTVILGVPVLQAAMGDAYAKYGVIAGISSFVFQLPVMLVMLEAHTWLNTGLPVVSQATGPLPPTTAEAVTPVPRGVALGDPHNKVAPGGGTPCGSAGGFSGDAVDGASEASPLRRSATHLTQRLLSNYVLWAIFVGFVLSLSKVGPKYLDPGPPPTVINGVAVYKPNEDFVEGLGFIDLVLDFLGRCTEPTALFAMGLWIPTQWHSFFHASPTPRTSTSGNAADRLHTRHCHQSTVLHWLKVLWLLVFKLILCPLIMVGLAKGFDLRDDSARAAVLVAAIPISLASFTLAEQYGVGEALLTKAVVFGTALLLPTAILWLEGLDSAGAFEFTKGVIPVPAPAGGAGAAGSGPPA